ncbi:THO complex subunit 2-like, partial [Trifolium medium]|nr:THO complex subunit 2-like [Trifolium medium]
MLLIMLTKISSIFPVTRRSGVNLERQVAKIKSDVREDLKVLATGVAAALVTRKLASSMTKSAAGNSAAVQSGIGLHVSQTESAREKHLDSGNIVKDRTVKTKTADGKSERTESFTATKSDSGHVKLKGSSMVNGLNAQSSLPAGQSRALRSAENPTQVAEFISRAPDEHVTRNVE